MEISIEINKDEYRKVMKMNDEIIKGLKWTTNKSNPFQRIQRAMYASTMGKFAAEGISPEGTKRWWKKWTEKYKEFRVRIMKQPRPILRLDGTYTTKSGKTYSYNLRLIKSIKKAGVNEKGVMLTTNAIHAATHQFGDLKRAGGGARGGRRRIGWFKRLKRWILGGKPRSMLPSLTVSPGIKSRRKRGRVRNIPPRPFFIWTRIDLKLVEVIFLTYWESCLTGRIAQMRSSGGGGI